MECRMHVANKSPTVSRGWGLDRAGGERLLAGGLGGIGLSDGSGARKSERSRGKWYIGFARGPLWDELSQEGKVGRFLPYTYERF